MKVCICKIKRHVPRGEITSEPREEMHRTEVWQNQALLSPAWGQHRIKERGLTWLSFCLPCHTHFKGSLRVFQFFISKERKASRDPLTDSSFQENGREHAGICARVNTAHARSLVLISPEKCLKFAQ